MKEPKPGQYVLIKNYTKKEIPSHWSIDGSMDYMAGKIFKVIGDGFVFSPITYNGKKKIFIDYQPCGKYVDMSKKLRYILKEDISYVFDSYCRLTLNELIEDKYNIFKNLEEFTLLYIVGNVLESSGWEKLDPKTNNTSYKLEKLKELWYSPVKDEIVEVLSETGEWIERRFVFKDGNKNICQSFLDDRTYYGYTQIRKRKRTTVWMTIAEIEKKLGIKNLKIKE